MKLARTNTAEITDLLRILNEVEMLHKELHRSDFEDIEWGEYELLGPMACPYGDVLHGSFIINLVRHLSDIHFQRILLNCQTLLDNCADSDQDVLDFNPDIKKGLELLEEWVDAEPGRRRDFPVKRVQHEELERIGDSMHASQCPECTKGSLAMVRDPQTQQLLNTDACLFCGQRFEYTDVVDGVTYRCYTKAGDLMHTLSALHK